MQNSDAEQNSNQNNRKNIDGIFVVPKIKELKKRIEGQKLIPTYTEILNSIEKRKPNRTQKIIILVCAVFLFAIMPIKFLSTGTILKAQAKSSMNKIDSLYSSIENGNIDQAKKEIDSLNNDISHIQKELEKMGQRNIFIAKFSPFKNFSTNTENILDVASSILKIGSSLAEDVLAFQNQDQTDQNIFDRISSLNQKLESLRGDIDSLELSIKSIDENQLNEKEKKYYTYFKENADSIKKYYNSSVEITELLPSFLGENLDKKYLVLFQNNTELRPTGGFIGSYGIVTLRDAKIKDIFVDSIYNPDGQLREKIEPPDPLKKITDNLAMRDANWNPSFPDSARLITQLYEKEGGFTPDGVIAVDTNIFLDLLDITGPIKLEKYDLEISKDNFIKTTQFKTSIDYDQSENNPKKFLDDLAPILMDRVMKFDKQQQAKALSAFAKNIIEKHIQFYSFNEKMQSIFSNMDIAGEIKSQPERSDYFYYVNSNVGGLKTNDKINEFISHNLNIDSNGFIIHEVTIKRVHTGTYDWPSGTNFSYVRFYVPDGSIVLNVENLEKTDAIKRDDNIGMLYLEDKANKYPGKATIEDLDISKEHGKTVIGSWQVIKPGEEQTIKIAYRTPLKLNGSRYDLFIQKQPGIISQNSKINFQNGSKLESKEVDIRKDVLISIDF